MVSFSFSTFSSNFVNICSSAFPSSAAVKLTAAAVRKQCQFTLPGQCAWYDFSIRGS